MPKKLKIAMKNKKKTVSVFSPNIEKRATDADLRVLDAALKAWMSWGEIRRRRRRNKDFTYGRQWGDLVKDDNGQWIAEGDLLARDSVSVCKHDICFHKSNENLCKPEAESQIYLSAMLRRSQIYLKSARLLIFGSKSSA